ncbi:MAG: SGNH/GDSL hydrolase family protein [Candidatus Velthaea sp.]
MALPLVLSACANHSPAAVPATLRRAPVSIAVLGDSLAFGTGASDSSNGFAFRVYRSIEAARPGSEISNYAIGGSTVSDVLRLQVARLRERHADCVLVCVGANDVVRQAAPAAFAQTYRALLAAVRERAPRAAIVVVGVPDVSISPLLRDRRASVQMLATLDDAAVRAAAKAAGAAYVDLLALTRREREPAAFLSADRFHPSDSGHAAIAAVTLPLVRSALERNAGGVFPRRFRK